ncbi:MAG: hypothetical protein U1E42_08380 [Rhodospirillales bacterium]
MTDLHAFLARIDDDTTLGNPHAAGVREVPMGGPVPVFASDADWEAGMRWYYGRLANDERHDTELRAIWAIEANR